MNAHRWWLDGLRGVLILAILAQLLGPAAAQEENADPIQHGCDLYSQARFDEAVDVLEGALLQGSLSAEERFQARLCLARSYVKQGDESAAKESFQSILRIDPTWEPDPFEIPPDEIAVFQQARKEIADELVPPEPTAPAAPSPVEEPGTVTRVEEDEGGKPWWLWPAVGVAVVGGVLVALVAGGGDDGGDGGGGGVAELPPFPDPPPEPGKR